MISQKISFIHCADLHLDSPFVGLSDISQPLGTRLRKATFQAFENVVSYAIKNRSDFLVISGDIYDGADRSVRAQVFLLNQLKRLSDAGIPSFIAHGNHDALSGWEMDRDLPPLATRFGPEVESVPLVLRGETVGTVHGYSYPVRDVGGNIAADFAGRRGEGLNIAVLHCNVGGRPDYENYAPCSLDDLRAAGMDYWALGHIHAAEIVHYDPLVVYPGNTQGRSIRETGKKGFYSVTITPASGSVPAAGSAEFVPCDVIRWRDEELSIEGMQRDEDLFTAIESVKERVRHDSAGRPTLLRVRLSGRGRLHEQLGRPGFLAGADGLRGTFNEHEEDRPDFVSIERISSVTAPPLDTDSLMSGDHFVADFLKEAASFRERGDLRSGVRAILEEDGLMGRLASREIQQRLDAFSDEQLAELVNRGAYAALTQLLEGEDAS